jgi:2-polyprenyl-3-methyl-5-hydroxy-6-metoxy-1,4-benzoquinol methylase
MSQIDPPKTRAALPAWQTCLDVEQQEAGHYLAYVNTGLLSLVDGVPKRILDLGCSSGAFGAALKEKFPGASVTGIEAGRAAAAEAAKRLDRVICERLEDVDFGAPGLAGQFDVVVAADILEHLVNPWQALLRVKGALAPNAQILASIPNVRNLALLSDLMVGGRWTYRELGLLDVTHLRFFTLHEILRMLQETGYRCEEYKANLTPALIALFEERRHQEKSTLRFGRIQLDDVSSRELFELCSEQFLLRCRAV